MTQHTPTTLITVFLAAFMFSFQCSVQADAFGTGTNAFNINFVQVSNTDNAADTTGYGAVSYEYRMSTYEVTIDAVRKATNAGLVGVVVIGGFLDRPVASLQWNQMAAFVNWLNTNSGYQAAYNLTVSNSTINLWSSEEAWTLGGTNLYRHKNAHYFLPNENEWYKAAYYNPSGTNYFDYATSSDTSPTPTTGSTNINTAVYSNSTGGNPSVANAGGLSPYGTMAQSGNVWELLESAFDGTNNFPNEQRVARGGSTFSMDPNLLSSSYRTNFGVGSSSGQYGFRVASVPEPSTYALLLVTGAGALYAWGRRRRRSSAK